MEFERINSPSLKELFVKQLEKMILSGSLAIGEKIPAERELAEKMGVSRTVINAGIADMAQKGFLEVRPRIGVFVADYRRTGSLSILISIMEYSGGLLPRREVKSLLQFRRAAETLSVSEAIRVMTDDGIESMKEHLKKLLDAKSPEETALGCYNFGLELDYLSENTLLPLLSNSFREPCIFLWTEYGKKYGIHLLKDHRLDIYRLLKKRDTKAAIDLVNGYYTDAIEGSRQIYGMK